MAFCLKIHLFFSCPLPSLFSLEWFTLPRHFIFPTLPPKSEVSGLSVAHSLRHAPTHGPTRDHFRAQQPRLSTDSFQGTHSRVPAGCSTCARERRCHHPLGSHSKQLREFPSWLEPCWSQDPKHLLGWGRASLLKATALQYKNTTISEAQGASSNFSAPIKGPSAKEDPLISPCAITKGPHLPQTTLTAARPRPTFFVVRILKPQRRSPARGRCEPPWGMPRSPARVPLRPPRSAAAPARPTPPPPPLSPHPTRGDRPGAGGGARAAAEGLGGAPPRGWGPRPRTLGMRTRSRAADRGPPAPAEGGGGCGRTAHRGGSRVERPGARRPFVRAAPGSPLCMPV